MPRIVTPCHCPPRTVSGRRTHSAKTVPTSLQPSRVASKNFERRTSHATNAVDVWVEALNWHCVEGAPVEDRARRACTR